MGCPGKLLGFTLSEIEFDSTFSTEYTAFLIAGNFWELHSLRLHAFESNSVSYHNNLIAICLSDCWKIWNSGSLKLNVRTIFPAQLSTEYLSYSCIKVTVLLKYFNLFNNVAVAPNKVGPRAKFPNCPYLVVLEEEKLSKYINLAADFQLMCMVCLPVIPTLVVLGSWSGCTIVVSACKMLNLYKEYSRTYPETAGLPIFKK